jgi:15-cis-phytoene synthase
MIGADRNLALSIVPAPNRSALAAVFAIDAAMGDVVRTTTDPMLGQIRLAWWRERLEELDGGGEAPAEPRLRAVESELISRRISGRDLGALEGGWRRLFDPFPWDVQTAEAIWFRGRLLFGIGAKILDRPDEAIEGAGGLWALVDAARHVSDAPSRAMLLMQAKTFARGIGGARFPAALRPLSMLAALAIRDAHHGEPFGREGTPPRAAAMFRHRLVGRLPRAG